MSFPRYKKYKPSGVELLGEVPEHWEVKRLKHLVANENYAGIQTGPFGGMLTDVLYQEEGEFKVYGQENVLSGDFEKGIRWIAAERFEALSNYHANSGDLLFTRKGSIGGCCSFPATAHPGIIDSDTIRVSLNQEVISQTFLLLAFKFSQYQEVQIQMLKRGAILSGLNTEVLANLVILTPPLSEQTQIAAFLDRETAKIDELVAEQRRLMELLKEKRQAVISHAVTQGLNPKAPMKPSGIEWLGDVPEHWEVIKLGLVSTFKGGAGFPDEYQGQTENEIPFFKVGDIVNSDESGVMRQANHTITRETAKLLRARIFPPDTIVFAKVGAALLLKRFRELGQPSCIDNNMMGMTAGNNAAADFLLYVLPILDFTLIVNPGAVPSINEGQISSQRIALAPLEEQATIVEYLNAETAKLDTLTAEAQRAIDLLQERRTALISAAVTGQIDVRAGGQCV